MKRLTGIIVVLAVALGLLLSDRMNRGESDLPEGRQEVLFWHFWGGADREIVEDVVRRFNASQEVHFVRAIAMPGNNLDAKLFLSIAGGDPPDLVNQDDPIVGDWAARGAIVAVDDFATEDEANRIESFLFPAARRLGIWQDRLYAVCNGLDVRALYYNQTELARRQLQPPQTLRELTDIAIQIRPPGSDASAPFFGYLPDFRRLWAWGYVFGGDFFDASNQRVLLDSAEIVAAAQWMTTFSKWYGPDTINAFRQGDQSLPGKTFPLLPVDENDMVGRYVLMMDGQWRTRDINAFLANRRARQIPAPQFGVCPLPPPPGGRRDAGWVNGNFFVVPRGAHNTAGAVAFIRFWIGMDSPDEAARTCAAGGWIPVSPTVVDAAPFEDFLGQQPLFAEFVRLAQSENQFPVPVIPGAPFFKRTVEQAASQAISHPEEDVQALFSRTGQRIQSRLDHWKKAFDR